VNRPTLYPRAACGIAETYEGVLCDTSNGKM